VRDRESLLRRRVHQCSSGTFSSVWQSVDGHAYGVTFNEIVDLGEIGPEGDLTRGTQDYLNRDNVEVSIDSLVRHSFFSFLFQT
jgi:hypothetical protein